MKIVIPYRDFRGPELKHTLRGIEKFIEKPEITIIGDLPKWIKNVSHIAFKDRPELQWKEQNIFYKLLLADFDFLFFNDDHYLLEPFNYEYHYSGTLKQNVLSLGNAFQKTIENTIDIFGNLNSYFRHAPIFIERKILDSISVIDWDKDWGYCVKSIYCHLKGVEGVEYPDLKIRSYYSIPIIKKLISGRPYFSTGNNAVNSCMINVLEELYPQKSIYEV